MKEDITQLNLQNNGCTLRCGLVMKEDITQLEPGLIIRENVVVW